MGNKILIQNGYLVNPGTGQEGYADILLKGIHPAHLPRGIQDRLEEDQCDAQYQKHRECQ